MMHCHIIVLILICLIFFVFDLITPIPDQSSDFEIEGKGTADWHWHDEDQQCSDNYNNAKFLMSKKSGSHACQRCPVVCTEHKSVDLSLFGTCNGNLDCDSNARRVNLCKSFIFATVIVVVHIAVAILIVKKSRKTGIISLAKGDPPETENLLKSQPEKGCPNPDFDQLKQKAKEQLLIEVLEKGMLPDKSWEKRDNFPHAFVKSTLDHVFQFRHDQSFKQTCAAFPATVSLVSHYSSGTYQQPGSSLELQKEGVRLSSFKNFSPNAPVSALRLSQAGFYYTGEGDVTKCFSCGVTYRGWQRGDRPTLVHAQISPNCSFVRGSDTANLPLPTPVTTKPDFDEASSLNGEHRSHLFGSPSVGLSHDGAPGRSAGSEVMQSDSAPDAVTDSLGMPSSGPQALGSSAQTSVVAQVTAAAASAPIPSSLATPENSMFSGAPLFGRATPMDGGAPRNQQMPAKRLDLGGAVYPLYSQMDARKRSYSNWVTDRGLPSVDGLITLGFFYAGYADCVRCFYCGIGLKSWEPGDNPAEVHARWRPTCEYLRLVKGNEFVDQVASGGRNVTSGPGNSNPGVNQPAATPAAGRDTTQVNTAPATPANSSGQQGSAPTAVQVPDIPVVRHARETGYSDQQIADGIEQLRVIGMERAINVMLAEILTNLFGDSPSQAQGRNAGNNSRGGTSGSGLSGNQSAPDGDSGLEPDAAPANDLERDIAPPGENVPDNAPAAADDNGGPLREQHDVLQQENDRLRNLRICQQCRDRPIGVIFLPCGHIVACTTCAPDIRRCLRCDTVIRATANVYFS